MGTSAPAVREHDFPITEPYKPPVAIPAPSPDRIVPFEPVTVPVREPAPLVPIRRRQDGVHYQ